MSNSELYYCVVCKKLEQINEAHQLFRTGFFRVVHPLGCCVACQEVLENRAVMPGDSAAQDSTDEIPILDDAKPYRDQTRLFNDKYSSESYMLIS
ncbi:hypothetical protein [Paenibacillus pinihumi]|uniref:hypothetical protein n=1 Tax=Paenibacillus pinihumi TaxID=669462 RepID=UPI0004165300|nr:hypothetical protein [Paenibacillus pinihumi]